LEKQEMMEEEEETDNVGEYNEDAYENDNMV
jgi:hypothetical protein